MRDAVNLDPLHIVARVTLGNFLLENRKISEAADVFSDGIALNDDVAELQFGLSRSNLAQGKNFEPGLRAIRKAINLGMKSEETYFVLGQFYQRLLQYDRAMKAFEKVLELNQDHIVAKQNIKILKEKINEDEFELFLNGSAKALWCRFLKFVVF